MGCYCDYDPPNFLHTKIITARKDHACCECGHVIVRGEKYEQTTGSWDGVISRYKTCEKCADLRDSLGECFIYGELKDGYLTYLDGHAHITAGKDSYEMCDAVFDKHRIG